MMLVRLTRAKRMQAGWIVALAYLLCVLVPSTSSALGIAHVATCMVDGVIAQVGPHDHATMDHAGMHHPSSDQTAPTTGHQKMAGACCVAMCVSALPAQLLDIPKPAPPVSVQAAETTRIMTGKTPPRLYRPPIS